MVNFDNHSGAHSLDISSFLLEANDKDEIIILHILVMQLLFLLLEVNQKLSGLI